MINTTANAKCKIHYLDEGVSRGRRGTIFFLHGWGLEGRTFLPSLRILARDRRVIAPDLPGFGKTKCHGNHWDYDQLADIMANVISDLSVERAHLIGHSLGAGVCVKICNIIPQKVLSLMLLDSAGIPLGSVSKFVLQRVWMLLEQLVVQLILSPRYSLLYFRSFAYNFLFNSASNYYAVDIPFHGDIRSAAQQVKQNTLIVWGERDRTTPAEMGAVLSQYFKNSRLLILHGNYYHEWSILYPVKFAEIANDFVSNWEEA